MSIGRDGLEKKLRRVIRAAVQRDASSMEDVERMIKCWDKRGGLEVSMTPKDQPKTKTDEPTFYPYDRETFVREARIGLKEVARLAEVTISQLQYWEQKGYIERENGHETGSERYRYSYRTVRKAALIRQGLESGLNLERANKEAIRYLESRGETRIEEPYYRMLEKAIEEKSELIAEFLLESENREELIRSLSTPAEDQV